MNTIAIAKDSWTLLTIPCQSDRKSKKISSKKPYLVKSRFFPS